MSNYSVGEDKDVDLESLAVDDAVAFADPGRARIPADAKCIVDPKGDFQGNWDLVMVACLMFTAIVTPFEVAYIEPAFNGLFIINRLVDLLFLIDLICQFFTPFYNGKMGGYVIGKGQIAKHYLMGWFTIDFVSILPFDSVGMLLQNEAVNQLKIFRIVRLARLLKLLRVLKGSRIFKRWQSRIGMQHSTMTMWKYLITVFALCHWLACLWWIVIGIDDQTEQKFTSIYDDGVGMWKVTNITETVPLSWATGYGMGTNEQWEQYLTSVYWSCMTVTTIGYGDVTPKTNAERGVAIFGMCVGAAAYAFIVGNICGIIATMDQATTEFNATLDDLNLYMAENRIPPEMRIRLREYFMYCKGMQRQEYYKELLVKMSPALRGEVCVFINKTWINSVPFFSRRGKLAAKIGEDEHRLFITAVAMKLTPAAYAPQEVLVHIGERAETMFIMQRGVVAKKGQIIASGKYFGEDIILKSDRRAYMVRALTFVDAFCLTKTSLREIMNQASFPGVAQQLRRAALCESFRQSFVRLAKISAGFGGSISHNLDAAAEQEKNARRVHRTNAFTGSRPSSATQTERPTEMYVQELDEQKHQSVSISPQSGRMVPVAHTAPHTPHTPHSQAPSSSQLSRSRGGKVARSGGRSKPPRILEMLQSRHDELVQAIAQVSHRSDKRADMLAERVEDVSNKKVLLLTIMCMILSGICIGLLVSNGQKCSS
jgi:potassium voltage-gated channel Eag-related subfamily H protein 7